MVGKGLRPRRGDVVKVSFSPQKGHEQEGHPQPGLSPREYNSRTGMLLCCRSQTRPKGYSTEETHPGRLEVTG